MREGVLRVLDSISAPAYVRNNRMDVLAATPGLTLNPADNGWVSPALDPTARRR